MRSFALILLVGFVSGCAVGPDFHRPGAPTETGYTRGGTLPATAAPGGVEQRFDPTKRIAADWWRIFGSPPLDALVADAIARNADLDAAQASLRVSHENLRAGYGVFFPQADVSAGAQREKFSPLRFGSGLPSSVFNLFTPQGTVSYTLDIWGGERRGVEAQRAQVESTRFAMLGTYIMLTGNVVDTVVARAAYAAELAATRDVITLQEEQVRIAEVQARAGTAPYANYLSLKSQLAATKATLPPLEARFDQTGTLLATLSGRTSAAWSPPSIALVDVTLPRDLPLSVPSMLVRQRPDVLAVEAQLHVASANIGVATAAMLPNVTLSGTYGVNSTDVTDLFGKNSPFWSVGAGLTQPVFRGGTLYHQRRAAIEAFQQEAARYRQTVLAAFQQVADALHGLVHDAETVEAQAAAVESAHAALQLLHANYEAGLVTYLQVLVADQQYLQARISYEQALAQRLQDAVGLYVALGGGWWNDPKLAE